MIQDHGVALKIIILIICLILGGANLFAANSLKKKPDSETFGKVKTIAKSWLYIAAPLLVSILMGRNAVVALFFLVTCYAIHELIKHSNYLERKLPFQIIFFGSTCVQYLALLMGWKILFFSLIPLLLAWILPAAVLLTGNISSLPRLIAIVVSPLITSYYLSHVPALLTIGHTLWASEAHALIAVLLLLLVTELNDVFQFIFGKAFGKKKIFPKISPQKTEAGFIGGLVASAVLFSFLGPFLLQMGFWSSLLVGTLISISGMLGDLMFSAVKRYYGVKDFSALIPGHGGILDRIDSLIITAPVFFHLLYFIKGLHL